VKKRKSSSRGEFCESFTYLELIKEKLKELIKGAEEELRQSKIR